MTSSVHVHALCGDEKEVIIRIEGDTPEEYILANGDEQLLYIFDERTLSVRERELGTDCAYGDQTGATKHPEFTEEQRLQWRMDLVVRYADHTGMQLEEAAEAFKKAEAVLTKAD